MEKLDFIKENLCIEKFLTVAELNTRDRNITEVNGRHSDAIFYIIDGSCTVWFDDGTQFTTNTGDVFYLPRHSVYKIKRNTDLFRFILCNFRFAEEPIKGAHFPLEYAKNTEPLFLKLLNLNLSPTLHKYTESMSILYKIYNTLQKSSENQPLNNRKSVLVDKAKQYMDENFSYTELSIPLLSEKAQVSEVYFRKLFKEQYGVSPAKYLTLLRLNHAKGLMRLPFLSLEECAKQSGFSSVQYFCRLFKKEFNISPGKYRNEL